MDILYIDAGRRIKALRELNRYSRETFAELVEISPKFLYEIEAGKKGFSAYTLYKISNELGISADYLLTGIETAGGASKALAERFGIEQQKNLEELLDVVYRMCFFYR